MDSKDIDAMRPPANDVMRTIAEEIMDARKVPRGMDDAFWLTEQILDAIKDAGWVIVRDPTND